MKTRVGFGFDTHRLGEGRPLILGGIHIASASGCIGHSDADVLIHAICDALFGAANMRDIGYHFPDTDSQYRGVDSTLLLKETCRLLSEEGWSIGNIDTTLVIQAPKINPHIPDMQKKLSEVMSIPVEDISIKAKTSEKLGFIGRGEGVSAYAVALIQK
ncbi:MAG: 2-C-methyl-D-erythritol 2,4-cyclodiphosphate synthase [Bacteroidales bacterium]|nr:2-C-methyl-D-erythritol 2,4-cyclodiphosphate synthase [Bacteroidales bacterium]